MEDKGGAKITDDIAIEDHITAYSRLFTTEHQNWVYEEELRDVPSLSLISKRAEYMNMPFIEKEVVQALKDMYPTKAPRPNGFHALFYQKV